LCIQYLVEKKAFTTQTARHLLDEIDPYVRKKGDYPPAAEIRINDYFKGGDGTAVKLRQELVRSAGRNGRFYLRIK